MFWGSLLLRCGDVEQNPGPPKQDMLRQIRLGSATGTGRRTSTDRTGPSSDGSQPTPPRQATLDSKMDDLMEMMQSMNTTMNSKFHDVESSMQELSAQYAALHQGVKDLREEVGTLRKENNELMKKNSELMSKIDQLERKTDDLEGRSKRNNLIFYGVPRDSNETNEQCEGRLQDLITDKLEMTRTVEFDRVHRLNNKPDSPIIARCCFYKDRVQILKAKRNLKGTNVFIGEDFSFRVREIRRKLSVHLKTARNNGRKATMVFDHLFIDDKKYFLDAHDQLKESS